MTLNPARHRRECSVPNKMCRSLAKVGLSAVHALLIRSSVEAINQHEHICEAACTLTSERVSVWCGGLRK